MRKDIHAKKKKNQCFAVWYNKYNTLYGGKLKGEKENVEKESDPWTELSRCQAFVLNTSHF